MNKKTKTLWVRRMGVIALACAGAVLGVLLVRYLWLDPYEIIAWKVFWRLFPDFGSTTGRGIDLILQTATFQKSMTGAGLGLAVGGIAGWKLLPRIYSARR